MPPSFLSKDNSKFIGALFGQFLEIDEEVVQSGFRQGYLRF